MTASRLIRLCLKELRESLRDRRTIVTLLLMPLMVYPLLSLVLNRVVPTDVPIDADRAVRIGISSQLRESGMETIVLLGFALLQDPDLTPVFVDPPRGESQTKPDGQPDIPLPHFVQLVENERLSLRRNNVDVVIVGKLIGPEESRTNDKAIAALAPMFKQMIGQKNLPAWFTPDLSKIAGTLGRYEIAFRYGDLRSERAFELVERSLTAINSLVTAKPIHESSPYTISGSPVAIRHEHADLLATMIPLVLVLMTMAGAVYPAIDLTAGERERGTMEALVVSPTSPVWILFSKYTAVVIVALLTALANLGAMSLTLWISGVGNLIFGNTALSAATVGQVLVLLILFTLFFAALLLAVTSFAKSFKEAQAYLIPLMLLALTPGVTSLMPDIRFTPVLATVPLVNIVLLAREVLQGDIRWSTTTVTLICNCIYASAALTIAAKLFGAGAAVQGSQGGWRDWLMRPKRSRPQATIDQLALLLAVMFPMHFICASYVWHSIPSIPLRKYLIAIAVITAMFSSVVPVGVAWYERIQISRAFRLTRGRLQTHWSTVIPISLLLACGLFTAQQFLSSLTYRMGFGFEARERVLAESLFASQFHNIPLPILLVTMSIVPAFCAEFLFRGLVLTTLHLLRPMAGMSIAALLYALFDTLTSQTLAVERFLPVFAGGLYLSWLSNRTRSIWVGVCVMIAMLSVPLAAKYAGHYLPQAQISLSAQTALPWSWNVTGLAAIVLGTWLTIRATRWPQSGETSQDESAKAATSGQRVGRSSQAIV